MKKLTAFVVTLFLTGALSVAHARTRALNPQPLPPGMKASAKVQVNPQPLPPGGANINRNLSPGSKVELNPQPFPPKGRTLNPQPLPPGAK